MCPPGGLPAFRTRVQNMPLKLFFKLYVRVASLAGLVILLCAALYTGVNSVRMQFWHERIPEPLMRWLAAVPEPADRYLWLESLYDLRISDKDSLELSPVTSERLGYGQVVAEKTSTGYRMLVGSYHGQILELLLRRPYQDVAEATALILLWHLDVAGPEQRDKVVSQLAGALHVGIRRVEDASVLPEGNVLDQVVSHGVVYYREEGADYGQVLVQLTDGELFVMDMAGDFDPWAWPVILLLMVALGGVLAAILFLSWREVDNNLRSVESVANRIARGEMGARVEAGSSNLVSRLAVSFNGMAEHMQRLVQVQREMIHAVSHELRTPVARIRFGVQMIEDCKDKASLHKQLEGIDGDIQELDELIDEILTYARLEQGGPVFSLKEESVTDIVRQVVSEQRILRPELTIEADIDEESEHWRMADVEPRYIHRAIQNLVGNAGRYARSQVLVHCRIDEDNCRIDVEDDGQGVPEEDWEKVFTAFARLDDSRTRTSGGYGLGLSIVRRILYWHGGQAFLGRSDKLGGARFSLVWPRKKAIEIVS